MKYVSGVLAIAVIAIFTQSAANTNPQSDRLSSQEQRGREIYFGIPATSTSVGGTPIKALIGDPPTEVEGTLMACANCHGEDGRGKPEGGVIPSDITWDALTKPYPVTDPRGRTHPGYTERQLVKAVCMGIDSAGNKLHVAMPRFQMSRDDIEALIAYLKRLGRDYTPGLSDSTIKIGTLLPVSGPSAEAGQAIKSVLTAYIDEINKQGGIYNRRIVLSTAEPGSTRAETVTNAEKLIREERPLALVAVLTSGAEKEIAAVCETNRVPLVGPLTVFAETGHPSNRHTFYLLSGVEQQARALINYSKNLKEHSSRIAILYSPDAVGPDTVEALQQYCKQSALAAVTTINGQIDGFGSPGLVQRLKSAADLILLLASGRDARGLATEAEKIGWLPMLLVPGSLATNELFDLPRGFENRALVALPSLPSDQTPAGTAEYRALVESHRLPTAHAALQMTALCSAKVLTQGLKLAGRSVTREKLVMSLERLYDFDTGLMPRIGFGANRRIGALGAYIVAFDSEKKRLRPVSAWLRLD